MLKQHLSDEEILLLTPRVRSWITSKAAKGGMSAIEGRGVHAIEAIAGGEVVAVKGGHIVAGSVATNLPETIRNSAFQIAADHFLAAVSRLYQTQTSA